MREGARLRRRSEGVVSLTSRWIGACALGWALVGAAVPAWYMAPHRLGLAWPAVALAACLVSGVLLGAVGIIAAMGLTDWSSLVAVGVPAGAALALVQAVAAGPRPLRWPATRRWGAGGALGSAVLLSAWAGPWSDWLGPWGANAPPPWTTEVTGPVRRWAGESLYELAAVMLGSLVTGRGAGPWMGSARLAARPAQPPPPPLPIRQGGNVPRLPHVGARAARRAAPAVDRAAPGAGGRHAGAAAPVRPGRPRRRIWLYAPAVGPPSALLALFDGWTYANVIPTPTILDNLIAAGRIPPTAALLVDNPDRRRELGLDAAFADFVADDLAPLARDALGAPADAGRTIVGGSSLGGVAAVFAALRRPDVFGRVLSQSGAFWCKGPDDRYEWLIREAARLPPLPLGFYLDAGVLEGRQFEGAPTQVEANRNLRDVLLSKGCPVAYAEFAGGHDPLCWRGTLADGLIALLGRDGPRTASRSPSPSE